MITAADTAAAIQRLRLAYKLPDNAAADVEGLTRLWAHVLQRLTRAQLDGAVDAYLASPELFFPKPGHMLALAPKGTGAGEDGQSLEARYFAWVKAGYTTEAGGPFTACPVCAAVVESLPRIQVRHDHQVHYARGVSYVGPRTGPCDDRGRMLPASGTSSERAV